MKMFFLKYKKNSFEPESNQRPKDIWQVDHYSPPLYQLSYRRKDIKKEKILQFKDITVAAITLKMLVPLLRRAPPFTTYVQNAYNAHA
jgi:hypothetical protein